jgi:hypothetical protein
LKPEPRFQKQPRDFWAVVKLVSEQLGYTEKKDRNDKEAPHRIKRYSAASVAECLRKRGLNDRATIERGWDRLLAEYSEHRADLLERVIEPALMNREQAKAAYDEMRAKKIEWRCPESLNIQTGEKRHPKYLGGLVNMVAELALGDATFDCNPGGLTTVTRGRVPLRTLTRRVDGAYPTINDPFAIWEVKEFYGTTTFGSRVADGIYESMLDGTELAELREAEKIDIKHYLMMDDHFTWWGLGRSFLVRAVDMLHGDLLDELFFGRQVLTEWPETVKSWPKTVATR